MIAQTRPDIANVTEQTVLALKDLEGRISVLKGDLAVLCQGLGHPQAAQVAASPSPAAFAASGPLSATLANPYAAALSSPFAAVGGPAFGAPGAPSPQTPFGNPAYASPFGNLAPFASGPWGTASPATHGFATPFGFAGPYGVSPFSALAAAQWAQAVQASLANPLAGVSPAAVGYAATPLAGYR